MYFNLRMNHQKYFLWVGKRKEPILGYATKNKEKNNPGTNVLNHKDTHLSPQQLTSSMRYKMSAPTFCKGYSKSCTDQFFMGIKLYKNIGYLKSWKSIRCHISMKVT